MELTITSIRLFTIMNRLTHKNSILLVKKSIAQCIISTRMKSSIAHHSSLAIFRRITLTQLMEKCYSKRMTACQRVMKITVRIKRKYTNTTTARRIQRSRQTLSQTIHYLTILLAPTTIRKILPLNSDMLSAVATWIQLAQQIKVVLYLKLFPVSYLTSIMKVTRSCQIRNASQLAIFSDKKQFFFFYPPS